MKNKVVGVAVSRLLGSVYLLAYPILRLAWRIGAPRSLRARMLVVDGNHVLLVRSHHHGQRWSLPGGAVKRREPLDDAARREVFEEAGCPVAVDHLLGIYDSFTEGKSEYVAVFIGHATAPLRPQAGMEIAEARFFPLTDLPPLIDSGMDRRVAEHLAGQAGLFGRW